MINQAPRLNRARSINNRKQAKFECERCEWTSNWLDIKGSFHRGVPCPYAILNYQLNGSF